MGRQQCKNTLNNKKHDMAPPEPSSSTTERPEHPNIDDTEENDLKNFMKIIEAFKEKMKNSLEEKMEKTKKKWE